MALKKRSVVLTGHATSVALEPEFWAILDRIAETKGLSQAGLLVWIDSQRGRRPMASACRLMALDWVQTTGGPTQIDGPAGSGGSTGMGSPSGGDSTGAG